MSSNLMTEYYSSSDNQGTPFVLKLLKYLNFKDGFYIEAGANDGITQSNTKYFEETLNWTGLLVEPSQAAYEKLILNRPNNFHRKACLVANDFTQTSIRGDFDGSLMSSIEGIRRSSASLSEVPCLRLGDILDELKVEKVDFFSLDTEGYELEVLKGLNLAKHHPRFILVEVYKKQKKDVFKFLKAHHYELLECISNFNKRDNPQWDGSHNDYLFEYRPSPKKSFLNRLFNLRRSA